MYIVLLSFNIYYDPTPPSWKVVANGIYPPICSIVTTRKGVCVYQYVVSLSLNLSSMFLLGTPMVRLSNQVLKVNLRFPILNVCINLVVLCHQSAAHRLQFIPKYSSYIVIRK